MKVSISWLRDYVDLDGVDVADLAHALTMAGLEVEALVDRYAYLDPIAVGRIVDIRPHPQADTLSLCDVDMGSGTKSIVCGATNISKGALVPVALPGADLPSGEKIAAGRIRGQISEGMLCSEAELAIGADASGILLLPEGAEPGTGLASVLGLKDMVIEFDLTPNRSDCLSMIGVAREVAAIVKKPLEYPSVTFSQGGIPISERASVTIEAPGACPRYDARLISGVKIGPSPFWLQDKLRSVGIRAINNVVDVTNFILMEMGQPLHAFDFDRLAEHRIVVKKAEKGEKFTTLDGVERNLSSDALMICDGKKPVALAGIMGGLDSEIEDDTTEVLIESAYFDPISIRRTAKRLGLSTESSHRFERGVDPEGVGKALERAAQLMAEFAGGEIATGVIDEYPHSIPETVIELSVDRTNRLLGTGFDREEISSYLESIELHVEPLDGDTLKVLPPTFRVDLKRPRDLMEEVARLSGYDQIPTTHPTSEVVAKEREKQLPARDQARQTLEGCGFSEIITYSFIGQKACDDLLLPDEDPRRRTVSILNPLTEDQDVMRTSLLPGLLLTMSKNRSQRNENLKIFELGKTFLGTGQNELPEEVEMISGLWTGARCGRTWHGNGKMVDFYDIKGVVETLLASLRVEKVRFVAPERPSAYPYLKPEAFAQVWAGDDLLGTVGEVTGKVLENYELAQLAFCFDLDFDRLVRRMKEEKRAKDISRFPSTSRDIALILDDAVEAQAVLDFIHGQNEALIEAIEVFDVYKGSPIPAGKKSLALKFTYRSSERNLTDSEVNSIHEAITGKTLKQYKAQLPSE